MSRCFPYTPPGYVCNRATGDSLIESIKIEKEKEKYKLEKKEQKRREKEQRKKEKKEKKKEKERLSASRSIAGESHKRKRDCDGFENSVEISSFANSKHPYTRKEFKPETEQFERSSLTEEYGQPVVIESLCYSSDGTQSQTKKSKIEQSPTNGNCTTQGKVIRFRLKKREPENADIPSTSGRTEDPVLKVVEGLPMKGTEYVIPRPNEQLAVNVLPSVKHDTNSLPPKKVSKPKSAYESLFSEWLPPPIQFDAMEVNGDDENWLLLGKKRTCQDGANLNAYDGLSGRQSMSLQSRAHLLPEVDLYALPYTVPF